MSQITRTGSGWGKRRTRSPLREARKSAEAGGDEESSDFSDTSGEYGDSDAEEDDAASAGNDKKPEPDGGAVRLLARDGGVLRVGYAPGVNEECATCILSAAELAERFRDAILNGEGGERARRLSDAWRPRP